MCACFSRLEVTDLKGLPHGNFQPEVVSVYVCVSDHSVSNHRPAGFSPVVCTHTFESFNHCCLAQSPCKRFTQVQEIRNIDDIKTVKTDRSCIEHSLMTTHLK